MMHRYCKFANVFKLTPIIKEPPHIDRPFPLFLLELLTGIQQLLISYIQRKRRALFIWKAQTHAQTPDQDRQK